MALCGKVRSRFAWIPWQLGVFLTKKKHQNHQADGGKVCGKFLGGSWNPKANDANVCEEILIEDCV